jgi:Transcription factor WhiB
MTIYDEPRSSCAPVGVFIDSLIERQPWMRDGLCAQTDPESFFPEKGGSTRAAKRICMGCPVAEECLRFAIENDERFGIWGGYCERERRRMKRGESVTRAFTNKPNRRANGHGYNCKCVECQAIKAGVA